MLIRNQSRKLDVPDAIAGKPGQWVEVRLLSGSQMDRARDACSERAIAKAKMLGAEFLRSIQERRAGDAPAALIAEKASDYDADELVNAAFVDSSEGALLEGEKASDVLDEATRNWLAAEVEAMNVRPLPKPPASEG